MINYLYNSSIGEKLKKRRIELGLDIEKISLELKINPGYIRLIEEDKYDFIDSDVFIKGFIKNYAEYLGIDSLPLLSKYRRDFSNKYKKTIMKKLKNNKKDIVITPKLLTSVLLTVSLLILFAIGINTLKISMTPPKLLLTAPIELIENEEKTIFLSQDRINFKGKIDPGNSLSINNIPVILKNDFSFESDYYSIMPSSSLFLFKVQNSLGITSESKLNIVYQDIEEFTEINAKIILTEDNNNIALLNIICDKKLCYNGEINRFFPVQIKAKSLLEIETNFPESLTVLINGNTYNLASRNTVLFLENGKINIL